MTTWLDGHASDAVQRRHLLFEIDFASPVRWTDCMIPIAWDGHMWTPKATAVSGLTTQQLAGASASLEVGNADNFMSALFFAGGAAEKTVTIWVACFDVADKGQIPQQVVKVFQGKIDSLSISNSGSACTASIMLGPPAEQTTVLLPNRRISDLLRTVG